METEKVTVKKNSWPIVAVSTALWFVSLLSATGIGQTYRVYDRAMLVVFVCFAYQMLIKRKFNKIKKSTMICLFIILLQNLYTHLIYGNNFIGYLAIYIIPLLYSLMTIDEKQMRMIGLTYGICGGAMLVAANYTKYFAGWNTNTIAMNCFFSYTVFIASLFDIKKKKHQQGIIIYSLIYFVLLLTLNSRSCILFSSFLLLCELGLIPIRSQIKRGNVLGLLLVPLITAMAVSIVSYPEVLASLNEWSQEHFNKTLYNGRDFLWVRGFGLWSQHPILGTGSLAIRWHNSAVSCLAGAGFLGYFIWIYAIREILVKACKYTKDNIIFGTVTAFLAIWLQQSTELGIISMQGTPVIFVLLGLILARINTLEKEECVEKANSEQEDVQN